MAKSKPAAPPAPAKPVAKAAAKAEPAKVEAKPAVKAATVAKPKVSAEVRSRMIADAAYYIAEKRGFIHGHHDADWAAAEKQIDALLAKGS
jgi:hypothetical protein